MPSTAPSRSAGGPLGAMVAGVILMNLPVMLTPSDAPSSAMITAGSVALLWGILDLKRVADGRPGILDRLRAALPALAWPWPKGYPGPAVAGATLWLVLVLGGLACAVARHAGDTVDTLLALAWVFNVTVAAIVFVRALRAPWPPGR